MGDARDRHHAVAVELAAHDHHAALKVDVADLKGRRLGDARTRRIDNFHADFCAMLLLYA